MDTSERRVATRPTEGMGLDQRHAVIRMNARGSGQRRDGRENRCRRLGDGVHVLEGARLFRQCPESRLRFSAHRAESCLRRIGLRRLVRSGRLDGANTVAGLGSCAASGRLRPRVGASTCHSERADRCHEYHRPGRHSFEAISTSCGRAAGRWHKSPRSSDAVGANVRAPVGAARPGPPRPAPFSLEGLHLRRGLGCRRAPRRCARVIRRVGRQRRGRPR